MRFCGILPKFSIIKSCFLLSFERDLFVSQHAISVSSINGYFSFDGSIRKELIVVIKDFNVGKDGRSKFASISTTFSLDEAPEFGDGDIEYVDDEVNEALDYESHDSDSNDEVLPERDDAKYTFVEHTDEILSCTFHPALNNIVVTGGIDDKAYVWDASNGNVIAACNNHDDSIESVIFSFDGKYLATSDLSGSTCIWNTKDYSLAKQFDLDDDLSWIEWHHSSNILISSSEKGIIYMFRASTGEKKLIMGPFGAICKCGKIFPDGKRLACGYSKGNLKIIDIKAGTAVNSIKYNENNEITCIDVHKDNNLVICGCENGDVFLANSKTGKIVSVLNNNRTDDPLNFIEAIAFCNDLRYNVAASGSLSGDLLIWDLNKQTLRHRTHFSTGINRLLWHPTRAILYTCHTNGVIHEYDSKTGEILRVLMGHKSCIYSFAISHDGTSMVTTSEDKTAKVYELK